MMASRVVARAAVVPWRVELWSLADLMSGKPSQVWKA